MKVSDDLQALIGKTRARVNLRYPWWLRPFLQRNVVAITLGRRVYVAAGIAQAEIETLLRHELTHVQQIARIGLVRFYWRYLAEYVALRRSGLPSAEAYQRISFEVEAFAAEKTL
jgi:Domain of unknown function (DUF4157)